MFMLPQQLQIPERNILIGLVLLQSLVLSAMARQVGSRGAFSLVVAVLLSA